MRVRILVALAGVVLASGALAPGSASAAGSDSFAGAVVLPPPSPSDFGQNFTATKEAGEPNHAGDTGGGSLWFRYTPTASGSVTVDTCSFNTFNTLLAVYTANNPGSPTVNNLTEVEGSNDNSCGDNSGPANEVIKFAATAGTTYYIALDGFNNARGNYELSITPTPANDDLDDAAALTSALPASVNGGTNVGATEEASENDHAGGFGGASVWYEWTAPAAFNGEVTVDTCASSFDTLLGVYQDGAAFPLTEIAGNNNGCGLQSRLSFQAAASTTYLIAVDAGPGLYRREQMGTIELDLTATPANDDLANAATLSGSLPITANGTNLGATAEPAEGPHASVQAFASVWYQWTAPATQTVAIDTCNSTVADTRIGVYTGSAHPLTPVVSNEDFCGSRGRVLLNATNGTSYKIAVDGAPPGAIQVRIAAPPAAPTITSSNPASPAEDDTTPLLIGTADGGSTVRIYAGGTCSGTPVATGTAAQFSSPGIQVTVPDGSTTTLRATATDASSNVSGCSAPFTYVELGSVSQPPPPVDLAPETRIDKAPKGRVKTRKARAKVRFEFSATEAGSSFECRLDQKAFAACSSPRALKVKPGKHTFAVRAIDAAGNTDATPATTAFRVKRKR